MFNHNVLKSKIVLPVYSMLTNPPPAFQTKQIAVVLLNASLSGNLCSTILSPSHPPDLRSNHSTE